jgi:hypothetical protein
MVHQNVMELMMDSIVNQEDIEHPTFGENVMYVSAFSDGLLTLIIRAEGLQVELFGANFVNVVEPMGDEEYDFQIMFLFEIRL